MNCLCGCGKEVSIGKSFILGHNRKRDLSIRFFEKVNKREGCWIWTGSVIKKDHPYGRLWYKNRKFLAHRISWVLHYGEIPKGMWVLHKCDNPLCVNPDHLFLGTRSDNVRDAVKKGRAFIPLLRGEQHPMHKLTKLQAEEIRRAPGSQRAIGRKFGICQFVVCAIKNNKLWKENASSKIAD